MAIRLGTMGSAYVDQCDAAGSSPEISVSKMELRLPTTHAPHTLREGEPCA